MRRVFIFLTTDTSRVIYNMKVKAQMGKETAAIHSHLRQLDAFPSGTIIIERVFRHSFILDLNIDRLPAFLISTFSPFHSDTMFGKNDFKSVDVLHMGTIRSFDLRSP